LLCDLLDSERRVVGHRTGDGVALSGAGRGEGPTAEGHKLHGCRGLSSADVSSDTIGSRAPAVDERRQRFRGQSRPSHAVWVCGDSRSTDDPQGASPCVPAPTLPAPARARTHDTEAPGRMVGRSELAGVPV
jgi:hypothetical protein